MNVENKQSESGLVLAIETSTELLGVALSSTTEVLSEITIKKPRVHSTLLLPLCLEILKIAGVVHRDLAGIAVSGGPGSFTGLRIGCATAQGLAVAWGLRVAPVDEFQVLLEQNQGFDAVSCVMGRARGQTVSSYYRKAKAGEADGSALLRKAIQWDEVVPAGPRSLAGLWTAIRSVEARNAGEAGRPEIAVAGDASEDFFAQAQKLSQDAFLLIPVSPYLSLPRPGVLGMIGARALKRGEGLEPQKVVPKYYRMSQAEALLRKPAP